MSASSLSLSRRHTILACSLDCERFVVFSPRLQHRHDDPTNTEDHHFDFTPENYEIVRTILAKYPDNYKRSAIIPLLDLAQRQCGNFLPVAAMAKVARIVGVRDAEVMEVATFYTMFNRERVGKYFIQLCGTTPCMVNGSEDIKKAIESELGIKCGRTWLKGFCYLKLPSLACCLISLDTKYDCCTTPGTAETTEDGLFTLIEVECLGACANAPMVQINDDFYECLTPDTMKQVLQSCRRGEPIPLSKFGR